MTTTNDWPTEGITCAGLWVTRDMETWQRIDTLSWSERAGAIAVASYSAWVATPDEAHERMRTAEEGLGAVMRKRPPSAAEVRAVALLWGNDFDGMVLVRWAFWSLLTFDTAPLVAHDDGNAEVVYANLEDVTGYLMLSPTGPVPWSEVARLVAEMEGGR